MMKKCPSCKKLLQDDAHHCHHCNSNLIDMDGNPIGKTPERVLAPELEKITLGIKVAMTLFLTVFFFIIGIVFSGTIFGLSILEMKSIGSIIFNLIWLFLSVTVAIFLAPITMKWIKLFLG